MCDNKDGPLAPFCQPTNGSQLNPGSTYDIIWDPSFFGSPDILLQVHGDLSPLSGETEQGKEGFVTNAIPAGNGSYTWTVLDTYLENGQDMLASLSLSIANSASGLETTIPGPQVELVRPRSAQQPNAAAIAVPVVFGTIFLALIGWYLWKRRLNPNFSFRDMLPAGGGGSAAGRSVKGSRIERIGPPIGGATFRMETMDLETARGGGGRNVFREELKRQQQTAR